MTKSGISVAIPAIPPRVSTMLTQAIEGVKAQTLQPDAVIVVLDMMREGAAAIRQRALDAVQTEWVAYLDDDDTWYPHHLETLHNLAKEHNADYVWSWFDGNNPFPMHRGRGVMNLDEPHHTTMGIMVKTWLSQEARFMPHPEAPPEWAGEDWYHQLQCIKILREKYGDEVAVTKFAGTGETTWTYRNHGRNTSGRPRW